MKKVLLSGNCNVDHPRIARMLTDNFDCQVVRSHGNGEAQELLKNEQFDLVMVNRIGEFDNKEGLDVIKSMQQDEKLKSVPAMVITNMQDKMDEAIEDGAVQGFGKSRIGDAEVVELLRGYLDAGLEKNGV